LHPTLLHPLQAGGDEDAVVAIQPNHVGHRAERYEFEQGIQARLCGLGKAPARAQFGAQRQQHIEHHADARQMLAREAAARLVGVDDGRSGRQFVAGQVVIGDQHPHAQRIGARHAGHTGDAVVHGDQPIGRAARARGSEIDDLRRQPIAVFEAVGHQVVHAGAQRAQPAQAHRAGGGAVAVVVGDDQQPLAAFDRVGQEARGAGHVRQLLRGDQVLRCQ
jgi:hypothetical protein